MLENEVSALRTRSSPSSKRELAATYVQLADAQVRDGKPVEAGRWLRALAKLGITDGKSRNQPFFVLPEGVCANVLAMQGQLAAASAAVDSELGMLQQNKGLGHSPYAAYLVRDRGSNRTRPR